VDWILFLHTYFNSINMHAIRIPSFLWVPASLIRIYCLLNMQVFHRAKHLQVVLTSAQCFQNRPYTQLENSDITLKVQKRCERLISTLEVTSKLVCHRKPEQQRVGFHQIKNQKQNRISLAGEEELICCSQDPSYLCCIALNCTKCWHEHWVKAKIYFA